MPKTTRRASVRRAGLYLHETLEAAFERKFDPWPLAADLVVRRLEEQGIKPTRQDRKTIERRMRTNRVDGLRLKSLDGKGDVSVSLTDADADAIINQVTPSPAKLADAMRQMLDEVLPPFLATVKATYPAAIRANEKRFRRQEASIARGWQEALALLGLLIELSCRMMRTVDDYCAEHAPTQPKLVQVLMRLHTRGVHVTREIKKLMESGYADAAMARWRTLHEIATVMCLIAEKGEPLAERYLEHQAVENCKSAERYRKAAAALGHRPPSRRELASLRAARDRAVQRYGKKFPEDYGWAVEALNGKPANFKEIEEAVGRSHLRPYYRLASHNVHAGVVGAVHKLGAVKPGKLLLEPSPVGLEEPGQNTALTLALVVAQLLRVCPAFDALVIARAALALADEAVQSFLSIGRSLKVTIALKPRRHRPALSWHR